MLRINAILVWIRIRVSMLQTNGFGFSSLTCKTLTKNYFKIRFLLFEGTFTSFFKDKKSKRSHKKL
jgi:hypothetical protein